MLTVNETKVHEPPTQNVIVVENIPEKDTEDEKDEEDEEDEENEEDDDEYDEIQAVIITVKGNKYLHDTQSNIVYTMEEEETGTWNGTEIKFY